jgi:hypothetical protein
MPIFKLTVIERQYWKSVWKVEAKNKEEAEKKFMVDGEGEVDDTDHIAMDSDFTPLVLEVKEVKEKG